MAARLKTLSLNTNSPPLERPGELTARRSKEKKTIIGQGQSRQTNFPALPKSKESAKETWENIRQKQTYFGFSLTYLCLFKLL